MQALPGRWHIDPRDGSAMRKGSPSLSVWRDGDWSAVVVGTLGGSVVTAWGSGPDAVTAGRRALAEYDRRRRVHLWRVTGALAVVSLLLLPWLAALWASL